MLKVIPYKVYEYFGKNFQDECIRHAEVSENAEFIVDINDAFETHTNMGEEELDVYVAELEYINGVSLEDYLHEEINITPINLAQITIDLLMIWHELIMRREYHNDLHKGNLMVELLDENIRRTDALNDRIRLVAIDLNSINSESLSNVSRIGDQNYVWQHIKSFVTLLREKYDYNGKNTDAEYRLIETLERVSNFIIPPSQNSDIPEFNELIKLIKEEFSNSFSYSPWNKKFSLTRLNEGINAQSIYSCHVPALLVDPENIWMKKISIAGPQLITGMRGCGKTMLLNSIDIHARLAKHNDDKPMEGDFKTDDYIGISTSCKYLVGCGDGNERMLIGKLIWLYAIETLKAARHLQEIDERIVTSDYYKNLMTVLEIIFGLDFPKEVRYSALLLEKFLCLHTDDIFKFDSNFRFEMSIINALELLASTIKGISPILDGRKIYFLLDDASTRYLSKETISYLLTNLLFIGTDCAFKITTELQSIIKFNSPGDVDTALETRDYQIFDLGADVYERTKNTKIGKKFIIDILKRRIKFYTSHPKVSPEEVLGDRTLTEIANKIVKSKKTSKKRKEIYYGISALTALCVGDIGDIIILYDMILMSGNNKFPIPPEKQTECYQQLCSRRIYNLERRNSKLRDYVKTFSEASYRLLIESQGKVERGECRNRLRQYNSLYVRITSGNKEKQSRQLRELIDAGIFVFADGTGAPRTKSSDTDPTLQFKLTFRKLFGLSNYIGLANSDRYELSGSDLEEWLENPSKDILLKNLCNKDNMTEEDLEEDVLEAIKEDNKNEQLRLFDFIDKEVENSQISKSLYSNYGNNDYLYKRIQFELKNLMGNYDVAIFGLGFEERTAASVDRVISSCLFKKAILIKYNESGKGQYIIDKISNMIGIENITIMAFNQYKAILELINSDDNILLDITGLYKPLIFYLIRNGILEKKHFDIVYTAAQYYYPTEEDIEKALQKYENISSADGFNDLMNELLIGELGPYENISLIPTKYDSILRPTALIGFLAPKNQRLFALLDDRDYECISLIIPEGSTLRNRLTKMAANIAVANYSNVNIDSIKINNMHMIWNNLIDTYSALYYRDGMNIDISLTGSKIQAVVSAAFSAVCNVAQCWYVQPQKFDTEHFTKGVKETECYTITMN
ncbi:hypothetical protein Q3318_18690 [Clostridioides difficile]